MAGIPGLSGWFGTVLNSPEPRALAEFYSALMGWEIHNADDPKSCAMEIPGTTNYLSVQYEDLYVRPVWPAAPGEQQMMLHLDIGVSGDLQEAVDAALALGAELPEFQPQDDVRVLLDPDGHPFCLYTDVE